MIKKISKVITGFKKFSDAKLDTLAGNIIVGLTGNAYFTFPGTMLADLKTAKDNYSEDLGNAVSRDTSSVLKKNKSKAKLQNTLSDVANEVNNQAKGDEIKLLSTNIPLAGTSSAHGELKVTSVLATFGEAAGEIICWVETTDVWHNGTDFAFELEDSPETDPNKWHRVHVNGHKVTLKGLISGKRYKITAAYKGKDSEELKWCVLIITHMAP